MKQSDLLAQETSDPNIKGCVDEIMISTPAKEGGEELITWNREDLELC